MLQRSGRDGTVPIASARRVVAAAAGRARAVDLCDAVELEPAALDDPSARLPLSQLAGMYEAAARLTGDDSFGLHVGSRVDPCSFGACGYIAANSATVGQAFSRLPRYLPLWTAGAGFRLEAEGRGARLSWEYFDHSIGETRHDCEMTLSAAAGIGFLGARDWRPREVHLQHAPPRRDAGEHRRLFRAPVHFRMPTSGLVLDKAALDAPIRGADPRLGAMLAAYADRELVAAPESLVGRLRAGLRAAVSDGRPSVSLLARRLGIGPRSLQRRLAEEGTSFRELLGAVRRELALEYLRDRRMPIATIADRLGFADATELQRAFRAWTGLSPGRYRRSASPLDGPATR
jgi:AraC-like DNA-binding protein